MTSKLAIGQRGEQRAREYLRQQGFCIYACNVQVGHGEIDIICYDRVQRCLVFVEVKTRSRAYGPFVPAADMHYRKRQNLLKSMHRWVADHEYEGAARTDVVYVVADRIADHHCDIFAEF